MKRCHYYKLDGRAISSMWLHPCIQLQARAAQEVGFRKGSVSNDNEKCVSLSLRQVDL